MARNQTFSIKSSIMPQVNATANTNLNEQELDKTHEAVPNVSAYSAPVQQTNNGGTSVGVNGYTSQENINMMPALENQHNLTNSEELQKKESFESSDANSQNAVVSVSLSRQKKTNRTIRKAVYLNDNTNEIAEKAMAKFGFSFNELINQMLAGLEGLD